MTGRDDRNGVSAVGSSYCAKRRWALDLTGDIAVATGLAERNREQRVPHILLEFGANHVQLDIELRAIARKIFSEFPLRLHQNRVRRIFDQLVQSDAEG